jgi:pimeloyl-ACP methyl ester carboxylesterase
LPTATEAVTDLPGYSPRSTPATDYSPARLARFVTRFMDAVGVDRAAVAGNSLGGLAALQLALSEPDRVVPVVHGRRAARRPQGFTEALDRFLWALRQR